MKNGKSTIFLTKIKTLFQYKKLKMDFEKNSSENPSECQLNENSNFFGSEAILSQIRHIPYRPSEKWTALEPTLYHRQDI